MYISTNDYNYLNWIKLQQKNIMLDYKALSTEIKLLGQSFGFQQIGITDTNLETYEEKFIDWLNKKFHGSMHYMETHGTKRSNPKNLIPNTQRVISARMDYLPANTSIFETLNNRNKAYLSRYALGRDYHRLVRKRLKKFADAIAELIGPYQYRVFCDSAPVLEKAIAEKAGLGWIGKHTNLINSKAGSWFFLGEIYTDIPLEIDAQVSKSHCGSCQACLKICPTEAIIAPYQLDARRCISYLTIELKGKIPEEFRKQIGNRIYGCDDCQLICPWNKFAKFTNETDFHPRHQLDKSDLLMLFSWDEREFLSKTEGSSIRRIGYDSWIRNIAVALGNAKTCNEMIHALSQKKYQIKNEMVVEHIDWALQQHMRN